MIYIRKIGIMLVKDKEKYFLVKGNEVYELNKIAAKIFQLCNGNYSDKSIIEKVGYEYESVNKDLISKDVYDILQLFCDEGLLIKKEM